MSIESVIPSSHLILCHPLLFLPPIPPSIRVFSNESTLRMRWPKYWSFSFSIIPSKEHPGPISFRMDWLDLLAVQGTLKSSPTPQFKSINSSALSFLYGPALTSVRSDEISRSVVSDSLRPHESQHARPLSITNFWSSPRLTSIESVMPSSHLILCHPLLLLPPIPPSIRVFSNESTLRMRWPNSKVLEFQL